MYRSLQTLWTKFVGRQRPGGGFRLGLVVVAVFLLLGMESVQARALVKDVMFTARSDGQGYVVRVRTADTIKAYGMPRTTGENTIKWVLYNTALHSDYQKTEPKGAVQRYETTTEDGHLTLTFHLTPSRQVKAEAYRDGASSDLLLNLAYKNKNRTPVAEAQSATEERSSSSQSGPQAQSAQEESSQASSGVVQTVSSTSEGTQGASREARERWKLDTIVIDPGHGGKDPGATANGLQEKDLVLEVSRKLGTYIENRLGIDVVYTRRDDRFIPLEERGHIANEAGAKLFLSLHINASRQTAARGTETYFLGPSKTEAAEKVMERENSVIKYEDDTETYEEYDEEALVRQTLTQSSYMRQSEKLASLVQNQFEKRVQRHNRGVHQAGFYVLWSASMPSVLVELGFLTNRQEARFLNSDRGQTYLASAVFRAVRAYKKQYEKGIFAGE